MPLVAAAVCPHPPLLVPEVAVGAAAELADLRAACDAAVDHLLSSAARTILVVGADVAAREYTNPFRGSFAAWGADVAIHLGHGGRLGHDGARDPGGTLPLSLLTGGWLLTRSRRSSGSPRSSGPPAGRFWRMVGVAADEPPDRCASYGARQTADPEPWAMLVMGDGSACRGSTSPGYDDPRAAPYDSGVARALADADPDALLALDPLLSAELKVAGRAPWQVLAGATRATGHAWRGRVRYDDAPYGVTYLVATWTPA